MMLVWMLAAAAAPLVAPIAEARHAIEVGRLDQARLMIGKAVAAGESGPAVDRALADFAFASGRMAEAATRYAALAASAPDVQVIERAGIAALKAGNIDRAGPWIEKATAADGASWRAWNALGVLADYRRDIAGADDAYARAAVLAPDEAEVLNNMGWSKILRGDWHGGLEALERAHALDPSSQRIANNRELAAAAIAEDLPARLLGESDQSWAARLNDAGVAARMRGDNARAVAAFSRAIEARNTWFARAANNLKLAQASN